MGEALLGRLGGSAFRRIAIVVGCNVCGLRCWSMSKGGGKELLQSEVLLGSWRGIMIGFKGCGV